MPVSATNTFDNTGSRYNISAVVTNGVFDEQKYQQYSPVYLSATFAINYCLSLASFTAIVVHTYCMFHTFLAV